MRNLSHLNGLHALEAALRLGSFSKAAEELGVTAAAVGQQVRTLERYLGRQLVRRTASGIVPTAETALALPRLSEGFGALRDTLAALKRPPSDRRLAVTAAPTLAETWLAPRLPAFYRMVPHVDLRLDSTGAVADLREGGFDLSLRHAGPAGDLYEDTELFPNYQIVVCAPDLAQRVPCAPLDDLAEAVTLLHIDENQTSDPGWFGWPGWARRNGLDPDRFGKGLWFSHSGVAQRAALDGQGLLLTGLVLALNELTAGRLVAPFGPETVCLTDYPYRMVRLKDRPYSALRRSFEGWIRGEAAATVAQMKAFHS